MSNFKLSARSLTNLDGVHPDLVMVVKAAIKWTVVDFAVIEGLRLEERQRALVASGASMSMNSRHLTGHAVDLVPYLGNQISWAWPLYTKLAYIMKYTAKEHNIDLIWGGDWHKFRDGPHFELSWRAYPV